MLNLSVSRSTAAQPRQIAVQREFNVNEQRGGLQGVFFNPAHELVCATEAVHDYNVAMLPTMFDGLMERIHSADCVTGVFEIPRYGEIGTEHVGRFHLLADGLLDHVKFNAMLLRRVARK